MIAIEFIAVAVALLGLSAWIIRKQRRATSCPAHSRAAGKLAMVMAILSTLAGVSLLVIAWMLWA